MGWEREYEHWRDMGHTWGPGVDDVYEYTEEELAELQRDQEAFQKKLASFRVAPRAEYLRAGKALKESLPSRKARIHGTVPYDWRKQYNDASLALCRRASESLGFSFALMDSSARQENRFAVAIDYHGWLEDRGGNIHRYAASNIKTAEDCLQLVADFAAIGETVTAYFGEGFHYCCNDTGELRYELESWCRRQDISLPCRAERKPSLDLQVSMASDTAVQSVKGCSREAVQKEER